MKLEFEISVDGKNISPEYRQQISEHLKAGGIIICPSDTCYSLAAACTEDATDIGDILNKILNRNPNWPFSVAVHNVNAAEILLADSKVSNRLLKHFTPGPLTLVGRINKEKLSLAKIIHSQDDDTIGIRIPDSAIERRVAEFAESPITTVPATGLTHQSPIKDYEQAKNAIINSITENNLSSKLKLAGIIVENTTFFNRLSTVIRVEDPYQELQVIRYGDISESELKLFLYDSGIMGWKIKTGVI